MNATFCLLGKKARSLRMLQTALKTSAALGLVLLAGYPAAGGPEPADSHSDWLKSWRAANPVWRGIHLSAGNDQQVATLAAELPKLAGVGVNVVILEVDYNFQFRSIPR